MRILFIATFAVVIFQHAFAKKLIVNTSGNSEFTTIQAAANVATPGDTVYILPGTYTESVEAMSSGTETLPIVYMGSKSEEIIINAATNDSNCGYDYGLAIFSKSHIEFHNITIQKACYAAVIMYGKCSNIQFNNVNISDNIHPLGYYTYGFALDGSEGTINEIEIVNCEVSYNSGHGIFLRNAVQHVLVDNCHIHHNGLLADDHTDNIALDVYPWEMAFSGIGPKHIEIRNCEINNSIRQGIWVWGVQNIWIHNNYLHHNGKTAIQIEDGTENFIVENNYALNNQQLGSTETGIWIDDTKYGVVRYNKLEDNQVGIKISKSDQVIARHNIIYKNNHENTHFFENGGITVLAYEETNNTNTSIVHNTFSNIGNPDASIKNSMIGFAEWESSSGAISNCKFFNNIFSEITNGYIIESWTSSGKLPDFESDYNLFYDDDTFQNMIQNSHTSWNDYLTETLNEKHSIFTDALFADTTNSNYQLTEESPCIDQGKFLTHTTSSGTGNVVQIENAMFFNHGYGITTGDTIKIGSNNAVTIADIDYNAQTLTLNENISWQQNNKVSFAYQGNGPDIGALESPFNAERTQITQNNNQAFMVFPNPASNYLSFTKTSSQTIKSIDIIDITANVVLSRQNHSHFIDISHLKNGLYLIIINKNHHDPIKFIKNS